MAKLVNLTPHEIAVVGKDGGVIRTLPPSGTIARVSPVTIQTGSIDGVPLFKTAAGKVNGLPAPCADTYLVVSRLVLDIAGKDRPDLLAPGELVRDEQGRVVGCRGLSR